MILSQRPEPLEFQSGLIDAMALEAVLEIIVGRRVVEMNPTQKDKARIWDFVQNTRPNLDDVVTNLGEVVEATERDVTVC